MKQHINKEQINELTDSSRKLLIEIEKDKPHWDCGYYNGVPKLTIGQMIEFLADGRDYNHMPDMTIQFKEFSSASLLDYGLFFKFGNDEIKHGELCDALWEAVKEVLNDS